MRTKFQLAHHTLAHEIVQGLPKLPFVKHECKIYILAKHHREHALKPSTKTLTRPFQLVQYGPFKASTKAKYIPLLMILCAFMGLFSSL